MTGSDETQPSGDSDRSASGRRRESIARAAPPPVTEAMITPRTVPLDPEEAAEMEGRVCHACGELNDPGRSVCRACGARTTALETEGREDTATREMTASERPRPDWASDVEEDPGFLWDGEAELWDEEKDGRIRAGRKKAPSPKRGVRVLLVLVAAAAILFLGFDVFINRSEAPQEGGAAASTIAEVEAGEDSTGAEEDTLESYVLRLYADQIADLAGEVEQLGSAGRRINDQWDDRIVRYEATLEDLRGLAPQARELFLRLREVNRPEAADMNTYQQMIAALSDMVRTADGMVTGLQSSDSGEARWQQLEAFEEAAADFQRLAGLVAARAGGG